MSKKNFILSLFIAIFSFAFTQNEINYSKSFEDAKEIARKENKSVLLIFSGTDWCRPCMVFDQTVLANKDFINYAKQNLTIYKASFPRRKKNNLSEEEKAYNEKLASIYNKKGAFPNILLFDKNSDTYHTLSYNITAEAFIQEIEKLINKK